MRTGRNIQRQLLGNAPKMEKSDILEHTNGRSAIVIGLEMAYIPSRFYQFPPSTNTTASITFF